MILNFENMSDLDLQNKAMELFNRMMEIEQKELPELAKQYKNVQQEQSRRYQRFFNDVQNKP